VAAATLMKAQKKRQNVVTAEWANTPRANDKKILEVEKK
jgi:hypothetical protein